MTNVHGEYLCVQTHYLMHMGVCLRVCLSVHVYPKLLVALHWGRELKQRPSGRCFLIN